MQIRYARRCKIGSGDNTMTKQIFTLILLAGLLNLPAANTSMADEAENTKPRNCITLRRVKSTKIVNDLNILFLTSGKTAYLNVLTEQCTGLSRYGQFQYRTTASSLCSLDTIQILTPGGFPGRSCPLGVFHPVNQKDALAILEGPPEQRDPEPIAPADVEDMNEGADESPD